MSRRSLLVCAVAFTLALLPVAAQTPPVAAALVPDSAPPVVQFQGVADGAIYGSVIAPTVTSPDADLATLRLTLDGVAWASGSTIGAGRHAIVAVATDTSSNTATASVSFIVDTLSPVLENLSPSPGAVNVGSSDALVVYVFSLTDDLSGIDTVRSGVQLRSPNGVLAQVVTPVTRVSGDSAGGTADYTQTLRIPKDSQGGVWIPRAVFYDLAGHTHSVNTSDLLGYGQTKVVVVSDAQPVDTVSARFLTAAPGFAVSGSPIVFTAAATDSFGHAIAGYEWTSSIDGVLGTSATAAFSTSALTVGTHRISVRARCANGTWSDPVALTASVLVSAAQSDVTAPTTGSDAQASYAGPASIALFPFDLYGSGVAHTYHVLDGGAQTEGTVVATSAPGAHVLRFWSVDRAGNIESATTVGFTIAAPVIVQTPANVGTPITAASVRRGAGFRVYGYVSPAHHSGAYLVTLLCYRYQSGHYVLRKTLKAARFEYSSTGSKYSVTMSLPYAGVWRIRAVHSDVEHSASSSRYRYVRVR